MSDKSERSIVHPPVLTSDVGDDIRVGVLGQSLRNNRLSTAESARNSSSTTLNAWEESVEDSLAGKQRHIGSDLLGGRSRSSNGPELAHGVFCLLSLELELNDDIVDAVGALLCDVSDGTPSARGQHDLVVCNERVLVDVTVNVTTGDVVTDLST